MVGFQTAYLMRYYPVEFIAAMLNSIMGSSEKVAFYIHFAESLGIQVLTPDINESFSKFTVKGDTIRFGMAAIKNVGMNVIEGIVKAREEKGEFISLSDFCNKVDPGTINKRAVESLIKAGAFDKLNGYRSQKLAVHEKLLDGAASQKKKNIDGQLSLFGGLDAGSMVEVPEIQYPRIKEFDKKYLLAMEKEMTGLYLTGHPLDEYKASLKSQTSMSVEEIMSSQETLEEEAMVTDPAAEIIMKPSVGVEDGERVIIGGIITEVSRKVTKNNKIMAFVKLEDLTGTIELIVFPNTLEKVNYMIEIDQLIVVRGKMSIREDEAPKVICEDIQPLEKLNSSKVFIRVSDSKTAKEVNWSLRPYLAPYRGDTPLYLFAAKERQSFRLGRDMWLDLKGDGFKFLQEKFGEENVKIVEDN